MNTTLKQTLGSDGVGKSCCIADLAEQYPHAAILSGTGLAGWGANIQEVISKPPTT